jgi:hypothetical protein
MSAFASFEIFECDGAFEILFGKPWLHSVRTTQVRDRRDPYQVKRARDRTTSARRHEAPELAAMEAADTGGQRAREVAPAQVEHIADTAHMDDAEGAVKAAHGEAAHTADMVHAGGAEGTVKAVHSGAEHVAETAHADDAECAVEVVHDETVHSRAEHTIDTAREMTVVHGEPEHVGTGTHTVGRDTIR